MPHPQWESLLFRCSLRSCPGVCFKANLPLGILLMLWDAILVLVLGMMGAVIPGSRKAGVTLWASQRME